VRFLTVRDLRSRGSEIWRSLRNGEEAVVTYNGSPVALLIGVQEDRLEETIRIVRQANAQAAVSRMRQRARERGLGRMSNKEIDDEIRAVRRTRQQ